MSGSSASPYLQWNDALAARFFCAEAEGQAVYLYVTDQVIKDVGRSLGGGLKEFIEAVRVGPVGATRAGFCQKALQVTEGWRSRGYRYPPYIAYLSLFVLAGGQEGDFDPRSYYPRLWSLLGEPESGTPPSFDRMLELWDDLERWSVQDRNGELGIFEARIVGGKIHIGLPLAQTLLTEAERRVLPRIFADAHLDPGSLPSERELRRALALYGSPWLTRRTMAQIERSSSDFLQALLDVVAEDFLNWNGQVPQPDSSKTSRPEVGAGLRLNLAIDRIAGRANSALRCRSKKEIPEDGLLLTSPSVDEPLTCSAYLPSWSGPLLTVMGDVFRPSPDIWRNGLKLDDSTSRWSVYLRPARVRVFVDGRGEQIPGLIEVLHLPRRSPCYLAFPTTDWPSLRGWIETECDGWQQLKLAGLPPDWTFGLIAEAKSDRGPRLVGDDLRFPDRRTLRLVGGIRSAPGSAFFSFARPRVILEGELPGDVVLCNGHALVEDAQWSSCYSLRQDLPVNERLLVEVHHGHEVVARRALYLVSGFEWRFERPIARFNTYGEPSEATDGISGAVLPGYSNGQLPRDLLRAPGLQLKEPRVYFLGRLPGQITEWPDNPLPEWEAIWAVPYGKRGKAIYCGGGVADAVPLARPAGTRSRMKAWHDLLWHRRKRISPPEGRGLRLLWRQYIEMARDA